jgi:hypothetical protein
MAPASAARVAWPAAAAGVHSGATIRIVRQHTAVRKRIGVQTLTNS